jgi:hypothetical protein
MKEEEPIREDDSDDKEFPYYHQYKSYLNNRIDGYVKDIEKYQKDCEKLSEEYKKTKKEEKRLYDLFLDFYLDNEKYKCRPYTETSCITALKNVQYKLDVLEKCQESLNKRKPVEPMLYNFGVKKEELDCCYNKDIDFSPVYNKIRQLISDEKDPEINKLLDIQWKTFEENNKPHILTNEEYHKINEDAYSLVRGFDCSSPSLIEEYVELLGGNKTETPKESNPSSDKVLLEEEVSDMSMLLEIALKDFVGKPSTPETREKIKDRLNELVGGKSDKNPFCVYIEE